MNRPYRNSEEPTPGDGNPTQERRPSRTARYLTENSGAVIPIGVLAAGVLVAGLALFSRIETGASERSALDKRLTVLEASSAAAQAQFSQALVEMRAARQELSSLHDAVIELSAELRAARRVPNLPQP